MKLKLIRFQRINNSLRMFKLKVKQKKLETMMIRQVNRLPLK